MESRIADPFTDSLARSTGQGDLALGHSFHEVDFLLLLNHERYAEEQAKKS